MLGKTMFVVSLVRDPALLTSLQIVLRFFQTDQAD